MWLQALMLAPYLAIAASLALAGAVTAICCSQPTPRGVGFRLEVFSEHHG